jgi:superfamily II DNA or RNA helicase
MGLPGSGSQILVDGQLVTVVVATPTDGGADLVVRLPDGTLTDAVLTTEQLAAGTIPENDGGGAGNPALLGLWGRWMQHAVPRIRSAVLATRPLRPYAHQDEAVFTHMLAQPRLRFLLADEPGTGKTVMTGMYIAEGTRQGLIPGKTVIVVPAHLVQKWRRDLRRFFGIDAVALTSELARDPRDLDPRVDVWVVSVDLFTHSEAVHRKVAGSRAAWSLAVFDEAHRLTPTSRYLSAAEHLSARTHHLLLLTATPHRGKEHFFRGLLHLLDPELYPWDPRETEYDRALRPSSLTFLRRMKEELYDHDGSKLFPKRFAETIPVTLTPLEEAAYTAVMDYVDTWYGDNATLARSIYGKRAASSLYAAAATVRRRHEALKGAAFTRGGVAVPDAVADAFGPAATMTSLEDDEAWEAAEDAVVAAATRDKQGELDAVSGVLDTIDDALRRGGSPSKWDRVLELVARHGIAPGKGQLLVFTEFADTARWLTGRFADAGYSTETLTGAVDHRGRDEMQERFLAGKFQVLVSTDAGGEGIDLQSAHVMVDWDVPWSLVRLEQRAGRLHRVGQTHEVFIYHLVAPATREGRVQEVMLANLEAVSESLGGRIFDLMDATAARAGFDFGAALIEAQRSPAASAAVHVPDTAELLARAKELVADEDNLRSRTDTKAAEARFRADRLEAINPVIVDGFIDQLARAKGWQLDYGPAAGLRFIRSAPQALPAALGGGTERLVAADGASVRQAQAEGAEGLSDVVVLGPTEEPFIELIDMAAEAGAPDLRRGAQLVDTGALTRYILCLYAAEVELHDGLRRSRRTAPLLIRYSGAGAFETAWESVMSLRAAVGTDPGVGPAASPPSPGMRSECLAEARRVLKREVERYRRERTAWVAKARDQLSTVEYRYLEELEELDAPTRKARAQVFDNLKAARLAQLDQIEQITSTQPRLIGWVEVHPGVVVTDLGYDPDAEKVAVATVLDELDAQDYLVDDRQGARVGYDLLARHKVTAEHRLVEVKGFTGDMGPVWLEQNEWAQALQRGGDYWLYVVDSCATTPSVRVRAKDPAGQLADGPRRIQRFQIRLTDLRRLMGEEP